MYRHCIMKVTRQNPTLMWGQTIHKYKIKRIITGCGMCGGESKHNAVIETKLERASYRKWGS